MTDNSAVQCLGICIVDPDTGVCLGCGRTPEEISGVPLPRPAPEAPRSVSLPANVAAEVGHDNP